jgi:hypothetical protein
MQPSGPDQDSLSAGRHDMPPIRAGWPRLRGSTGRSKTGRSKTGRWLIALSSVLIMLTLAAAALFARLLAGPLEADLIKDRVAQAIERQVGADLDVDVRAASLELTEQGLALHIRDVRLSDRDGVTLLTAPHAFLTFDPLRLLALELVPQRVDLSGVELDVAIGVDGSLSIGRPAAPMEDAAGPEVLQPAAAARALAALERLARAPAIQSLSITGSRLRLRGEAPDSERLYQDVAIRFAPDQEGVRLVADALHDGRPLAARLSIMPAADQGRVLRAEASGVTAADLPMLGAMPIAALSETPLTLDLAAVLGADGVVNTVDLGLSVSEGRVPLGPEPDMRIRFDRLALALGWRRGEAGITVRSAELVDGATRLRLTGMLEVDGNGVTRFTGEGRDLTLADGDRPVLIDRLTMTARHERGADRLTVEQLTLIGPETRIGLSADVAGLGGSPAIAMNLTAERMPIRTAIRYWPPMSAPLARRFLVRHVPEGMLDRLTMRLSMSEDVFRDAMANRPLPAESFVADLQISEGRLRLDGGLPVLSGLKVAGTINARAAEARITAGAVEAPGGRRLQLTEGQIAFSGLETFTPEARVQGRLQGPAEAAVEILTLPPFRRGAAARIEPGSLRGTLDGRLTLTFPMVETLEPAQVQVSGQATLSGGTLENAIGKDRLDALALQLGLDRGRLSARGEARWQGTPLSLEARADAAGRGGEVVLAMTLDEAARLRRGVGKAGQITGPTPVRVTASLDGREGRSIVVDMDLTRAAIDGVLPGLSKPAGRPGRLSFDIEPRGEGTRLDDLSFSAGATQLRGSIDLSADGSPVAARFSQVRLSPGDNVTASFERAPAGGRIIIRGNNFDLRPFLKRDRSDGQGDLDLDLRTTLLSGFNGEVLTNAEVRLEVQDGQPRQVALAGRLNGARVSARGQARGREPLQVQVDVDDAGAFLRFLDLYGRMRGGRIDGAVALAGGERGSGILLIRDFSLRNEPALRNLIAAAPPDGRARAPGADDVPFTKMRVEFVRSGSEINVREAVIFGPQIGITLAGSLDQRRDRIRMSGTFVPAFGLNNLFAQIPLFGDILGGGRNQGLLGVTFGLSGRAAQPTIQINPLSAVAPGIFRRIFEFRNDNGPPPAQAPIPPSGAN